MPRHISPLKNNSKKSRKSPHARPYKLGDWGEILVSSRGPEVWFHRALKFCEEARIRQALRDWACSSSSNLGVCLVPPTVTQACAASTALAAPRSATPNALATPRHLGARRRALHRHCTLGHHLLYAKWHPLLDDPKDSQIQVVCFSQHWFELYRCILRQRRMWGIGWEHHRPLHYRCSTEPVDLPRSEDTN
jgi:hypothetical protein